MIITNSYSWECDISRRDSFNICDLVVMIVINDRQSNVPKPQCKSQKNQEYPNQLEEVVFGVNDAWNTGY